MDDMDEQNGCLHYTPQKNKALRRHEDGVVGFSRALADWGPEDEAAEVPMVCNRGDVLVHHCLTVHRAGLNTTADRHRRTIGFGYRSVNVVSSPPSIYLLILFSAQTLTLPANRRWALRL